MQADPPARRKQSGDSSDDLDWVAQQLIDRPRKRLAFKRPIELIGDLMLR